MRIGTIGLIKGINSKTSPIKLNPTINLRAIVNALEIIFDEHYSYLNTKTGQIVSVSKDTLSFVEDGNYSQDDAKDEEISLAIEIMEQFHYIQLPTKYDIHDYKIMEDFCYTVKDQYLKNKLINKIRGRGAFCRFRTTIEMHGILEDWYAYKTSELKKLAIKWCNEHNIKFHEFEPF